MAVQAKSVLLTGAGGFIGRHTIKPLLERGYIVHAISSRARDKTDFDNLYWHQADLLDEVRIWRLLPELVPTHLLHLAWYTEHGKYWNAPENLAWVRASLSLLEAFHASGGRRAVMTGSCVEYDWQCGDGVFNEEKTPKRSTFLYGTCKYALYQMSAHFCRLQGPSFAWGRPFFMYGPDEPPSRLISSVIRSLLAGESAKCSHGGQVRDFLHVADVASGLVALLDSPVEGAVNIASGHGIALKDLIGQVGEIIGRPDRIHWGAIPPQPNEPASIVADVTRLFDEVGWQPRYSIRTGLAETVEDWRRQMEGASCWL